MSAPKYTIFAGVNGVGKTSLFTILNKYEDLGERINIDEIVASKGSWRDSLLQIMASRKAMKMIADCIKRGVTFHQETTIPGIAIQKQIKKAKAAGYTIQLYYVGVENLQTAINRVNRRVEKGGHGVDEELIRRRFDKLPETFHNIIPMCDVAFFYDNTLKLRQIAYLANNVLVDYDSDLPVWFWEIIARKDLNIPK